MLKLHPLPPAAKSLLDRAQAPPRLIAHLTLTHDVAARLVAGLKVRWPDLPFDREAVLFGAATHDIGKVVYLEELQRPGGRHEVAGEQVLRELGISADLARFSRTHARWAKDSPLEDLLVALADKVWKGKREATLEELLVDRITSEAGEPCWQVFLTLDDLLTDLARSADARIAWQRSEGA